MADAHRPLERRQIGPSVALRHSAAAPQSATSELEGLRRQESQRLRQEAGEPGLQILVRAPVTAALFRSAPKPAEFKL